MGGCTLALSRAAPRNTYAPGGDALGPPDKPGLFIDATADAFSSTTRSNQVAEMLGARVSSLDGLHHFWAVEDPTAAAEMLQSFWAEVS